MWKTSNNIGYNLPGYNFLRSDQIWSNKLEKKYRLSRAFEWYEIHLYVIKHLKVIADQRRLALSLWAYNGKVPNKFKIKLFKKPFPKIYLIFPSPIKLTNSFSSIQIPTGTPFLSAFSQLLAVKLHLFLTWIKS